MRDGQPLVARRSQQLHSTRQDTTSPTTRHLFDPSGVLRPQQTKNFFTQSMTPRWRSRPLKIRRLRCLHRFEHELSRTLSTSTQSAAADGYPFSKNFTR